MESDGNKSQISQGGTPLIPQHGLQSLSCACACLSFNAPNVTLPSIWVRRVERLTWGLRPRGISVKTSRALQCKSMHKHLSLSAVLYLRSLQTSHILSSVPPQNIFSPVCLRKRYPHVFASAKHPFRWNFQINITWYHHMVPSPKEPAISTSVCSVEFKA